MTADEVMQNVVSHQACAEGVVWVTGKDSNAVWDSTDEFAAPYLFWWAVQNAGQPKWKTREDVAVVLKKIADVACKHAKHQIESIQQLMTRFDLQRADFADHALLIYYRLEDILKENVSKFRLEIIPILRELRA
jgi:hypothetical protein